MTAPNLFRLDECQYTFPPPHPFNNERLRRTILLLDALGVPPESFPDGNWDEVYAAHDSTYLDRLRAACAGELIDHNELARWGLVGDTPVFPELAEAGRLIAYGSAIAAQRLLLGSQVAVHLAGGLHHAQRARASGFCAINDIAVAITQLKQKFKRIAYIDIDLHAGDGVAAFFDADPDVLTCSIHQYGNGFYPGTGHFLEVGSAHATVNVALPAETSGDVWRWAFQSAILPIVRHFSPEAIVLQMGCDAHVLDPLGRLRVHIHEWLGAVEDVRSLGVPILAVGGGGYRIQNVPRMWAGAVLTLLGKEIPEYVPEELVELIGDRTMMDDQMLAPSGMGMSVAQSCVETLRSEFPIISD